MYSFKNIFHLRFLVCKSKRTVGFYQNYWSFVVKTVNHPIEKLFRITRNVSFGFGPGTLVESSESQLPKSYVHQVA